MTEPDPTTPGVENVCAAMVPMGGAVWSQHSLWPEASGRERPALLHVTHDWGGGIERWLRDFTAHDRQHEHLVLRAIVGHDGVGRRLELHDARHPEIPLLRHDLTAPIAAAANVHPQADAMLDGVVEAFGVAAVVVASLLGHSLQVLRTGLPTLFVVHDYFPFCPALITHFEGVCPDCTPSRLRDCMARNPANLLLGRADVERWEAMRTAFADCLRRPGVRVAAPSKAAARRLAQLSPELSVVPVEIVPNGIPDAFVADPSLPRRAGPLRIVVPGRMTVHKGLADLEALLPRLPDGAEVVLLGCGAEAASLARRRGVTVISEYVPEQLPALIRAHAPDCALFLSLWPETFSYTLSEMRALGLVPVARRLGAFADRIVHDRDGLLFDDVGGAAECLRDLSADDALRARLRAGAAQVAVPRVGNMVAAYHALLGPLAPRLTPATAVVAALAREGRAGHEAQLTLQTALEAVRAREAALAQRLERVERELQATVAGPAPVPPAIGPAQTVPPVGIDRLRLRLRLLRQAVPAALRRAGSPLVLLQRACKVWRSGGPGAARSALRDFALIGAASSAPVVTPPPAAPTPSASPAVRAQTELRAEQYVAQAAPPPDVASRIRAIAFYLPQFHPIPENDAWWGRGFTEWTNVTRAVPQFPGHFQPRLPADLGFYDLRLPQVMREQIALARRHGIHAFCFHHYWFSGRRLLETPVDNFLADTTLDFPFCLCWANESWSRRWDGSEDDVLIEQLYREEDEPRFIDDLLPYLRDTRYLRVGGRPLLLVYRVDQLPDARRAAAVWRARCLAAGVGDPLLLAVQSFEIQDPRDYGFDGAVEFPPHKYHLPFINDSIDGLDPGYAGSIRQYRVAVEQARAQVWPDYRWYRGVMPSWDNEARKPGRGAVFHGSTPDLYARWLAHVCAETDARHVDADDKLVFINAWNEWAEGAYLEPDRRYGHAYLRATADVLGAFPARAARKVLVVSHDAHPHGAQLLALHMARSLRRDFGCETHILLCGDGPLREAFAREGVLHDATGAGSDGVCELIRALAGQGVREALCNTAVVGLVVEQLAAQGMRCVSLIHELPGLLRRYGLEAEIAKIARYAEKLVFAAPEVRDAFLTLQPVAAEKCVLRPQGLYQTNPFLAEREVVRAELRSECGLSSQARIALGIGYADRRKGVDLFAAAAACCECADTVFVWIGLEDPQTVAAVRADSACAAALADGRLVLAGPMAPEAVQRWLAAADVFVLSSREDPYPSVVLEAMNAGLPLVAFDGGGGYVAPVRESGGELVAMEDVVALAAAVTRALSLPPGQRAARAEALRDIVHARYGFADYVADLLGLFGPRPPGVSVIVPNYNYARYIEQRIRSIQAQTVRPREILLLDDASTDDSVARAERVLAAGDIPWRIVRNAANAGCYAQWLRGIALARGELVWIAEADDACEPNFLESLLPAFEDADVVLAYCQSRQIDADGRQIAPDYLDYTDDIDPVRWRMPYVRDGSDEIREALAFKNTIPNASAVLMRRPDLTAIASQLGELQHAGDWLVYLHLLRSGRIAYLPASLNLHRRHAGGLTMNPLKAMRLMREIVAVQRLALAGLPDAIALRGRIAEINQGTWEDLGLHRRSTARWEDAPELASAPLGVPPGAQENAV